jgi:hypothetical protein
MGEFGYFIDFDQTEPAYDPGLSVNCPVCYSTLSRPVKTISLMLIGDRRSYFYRAHKGCYDSLSDEQKTTLDSALIDALAHARECN